MRNFIFESLFKKDYPKNFLTQIIQKNTIIQHMRGNFKSMNHLFIGEYIRETQNKSVSR